MRSLGCQPGLLKCKRIKRGKEVFLMAQQRKSKNNKVKQYRKPLNLNIGMLIFGAIFYLCDHLCDHVLPDGSYCPL